MRVNRFCVRNVFFFFKQKTAYEMRISDWSSDVCSSDLDDARLVAARAQRQRFERICELAVDIEVLPDLHRSEPRQQVLTLPLVHRMAANHCGADPVHRPLVGRGIAIVALVLGGIGLLVRRSEEHTSELQSLMRISSAVFCL